MTFPSDILLVQGDTTPSSLPTAGRILLYAKSNGIFYSLDSSGVENPIGGGGSGTVSSVSVTTANGVSGTVVNPTTTPSISLTLGAITPTSVAATGGISASTLAASGTITGGSLTVTGLVSGSNFSGSSSGVNTGNQTITLTGDVAGTGTGTFPATLATVNSNVGTFGSGTQVPVVTVDGKGRITAISVVTISGGGSGTVTSVAATGANGITVTGSPITGAGTLAFSLGAITPASVSATGTVTGSNLSGTNTGDQTITLTGAITGSGTGSFATTYAGNLPVANLASGVGASTTTFWRGDGTWAAPTGTGTVSSVAVSGGTTGLTTSGGPITTTGTITLAGTLSIANGGTGATSLSAAQTALFPVQTGQAGKYLTTNGTVLSWSTPATGSVTSVAASGANGIIVTGSPITAAGTLAFSLGAITPTGITASGTITGTNLSGTNTGDQTIALTGDVTGTGTGTFAATLATVNTNVGTFGDAYNVPVPTVNGKGLVTAVATVPIDLSTSDTVNPGSSFIVPAGRQYVVYSQYEVDGLLSNSGTVIVV